MYGWMPKHLYKGPIPSLLHSYVTYSLPQSYDRFTFTVDIFWMSGNFCCTDFATIATRLFRCGSTRWPTSFIITPKGTVPLRTVFKSVNTFTKILKCVYFFKKKLVLHIHRICVLFFFLDFLVILFLKLNFLWDDIHSICIIEVGLYG